MKKYDAIFFDWDGTAVQSRKAPVDLIIPPMQQLLEQGKKLAVISGTTYQNIANGNLHTYFTKKQRQNLFLGLGRGAYNYGFDDAGNKYLISTMVPGREKLLAVHDVCYQIHHKLLWKFGISTDIIFSRPNYCKIDLMVENDRGDALYLQEGEKERLLSHLQTHGFTDGILGLIDFAEAVGREMNHPVVATTDAKYLEVGISSKSDNVDTLFGHFSQQYGIQDKDCAYWGDEYIGLDKGLYGSDSYMITEKTKNGDFFDVSDTPGDRPPKVHQIGGGVKQFHDFLLIQNQ